MSQKAKVGADENNEKQANHEHLRIKQTRKTKKHLKTRKTKKIRNTSKIKETGKPKKRKKLCTHAITK